ncbi:MAG: TetR family transcriptional regulator C-terminal domain-containing protein [Yoonia sp.]|uniref:TetR family transcriptional regulator C-terminal domain-containing protein n=1 Tax=Rhodobacterales TaxID=204455 RepID=UPI001FF347C3|nr:TetR family transcriptional regulator C-terminal domain-containing protein [Loktanella sp. F6476L]MCK0120576.1 TetR family transcriptional regulator C-terminal domain-containing protein [Loktanella sp. F6476L]UWQ99358.1 TetR family transcriptional regulator C-terminal domain-containing protein [Rhodobacteraceae bacterium S2214]
MPKSATRIQQKNQAAIMAAGLEVFSQFGFRGSTLDQVADAAGLSKPNLLYYFPSKDAIYSALLSRLLENWLEPLHQMDDNGDPVEEILAYANRKLAMSRDFPRESRLFANEILQGAPRIKDVLAGELRELVEAKATVIEGWIADGKIRPVDPVHLIFSIWSLTQHYADFDVQVRSILGDTDPFVSAESHLDDVFRRLLAV